jgi:hypothetical protein
VKSSSNEIIYIFAVKPPKTKPMKKVVFTLMVLSITLAVAAQQRAVISRSLQDKAVLSPKWNGQADVPVQGVNTTVNTKSVADEVMGTSRYDNQTNGSMPNRMILWPDNTISASWMRAMLDASYGDRGTGYNYFNGTAWGPVPTDRIETTRSGWPSFNAWMGNGEIVFGHNSTATLIMNTRPAKGTGAWTQSLAPTGPSGVTTMLWPSVITSGPNHQYVHVIVIGQPSYTGMTDALLYFRSLDGGATWDKQGVILPGMALTDNIGYSGDDYTWAEPHGDTLAFVVGGNWSDGFIMKSNDNGTTWTKTVFFDNPFKLAPMSQVVPTFYCLDGSTAIELDHSGMAHVAVGRMRANGDGTAHYYFPGTDGLIYWNESMPMMDTTFISNLDTLEAHGQLAGYVAANSAGDSIVGFPYYGSGLSSFPRINIDDADNVYIIWSGLTVGNPDPTPYNYRHIWGRFYKKSTHMMGDLIDFNADFNYIFQEFVYPAVTSKMKGMKIQLMVQTSSQPGSNIQAGTTAPPVPIHDVDFAFRELDLSSFWAVGTGESPALSANRVSGNFPNPVTEMTQVNVHLALPAKVTVEVTDVLGNAVMNIDKGSCAAGDYRVSLDCSGLANGFYLVTVKINGEKFTNRIIKK